MDNERKFSSTVEDDDDDNEGRQTECSSSKVVDVMDDDETHLYCLLRFCRADGDDEKAISSLPERGSMAAVAKGEEGMKFSAIADR